MKKLSALMVGACLALSMAATPVYATEAEYAKVQLLTVQAESSYRDSDVDIQYREDRETNTVTADVVDKETGKVLESFCERPDVSIDSVRAVKRDKTSRATQTYNTTLAHNVTLEKPNGRAIQAYVWVEVNVTADFSWAQINRVNKCGHQSGNSGAYHLQAANTTVRTTQFPCNTVSMQINGIIEVSSTNTVGFSFSGLQTLGFGMSGSSSSQWTARKSYNRQTSFSLM